MRARAAVFILLALVVVLLALAQVQVRTDIRDFFFPGDTADSDFLAGQLQSDALSRRYLISIDHPGRDTARAAPFTDRLQRRLSRLEGVQDVRINRFSETDLKRLVQFYSPQAVHLFSLDPQRDFARLVQPAGLEAQARTVKEALLGPDPMLVKSLLAQDPMLLTLHLFSQLSAVVDAAGSAGEHTTFTLDSRAEGLDLDAQARLQQALTSAFDELNGEYGGAYAMQYTGVPVFAVAIRAQAKQDIQKIGTLSALAVMLLSLFVFRSWRVLVCIAILLVFTVATAALVTQAVFGYVHGLTLALGMTLIGVCIDYFIHSLVHAGDKVAQARVQAVRRIWPTLLVGGATTVVGYIALSISGFPGLRQIALFTGTGIVTALLATRYFLPALMELFVVRVRPRLTLGCLLDWARAPYVRPGAFVLVGLIAVGGGTRLHWGNDLDMQTPQLAQLIAQDKQIRARLASVEPGRFVLIEGGTLEQALQRAEQVQPLLASLKDEGFLDHFYPLFPWFASQRLQDANARAWNTRVTPELRADWSRALSGQGLVAAAFPPLAASKAPDLTLEALRDSPAWEFVSRQLTVAPGRASIALWLGRHDPVAVRSALEGMKGVRYFSQKDSLDRLAAEYRERARTMLLLGIAAILVLLSVRYRSLATGIVVLTPAALAILLLLGGWGLAGLPLGMLHLIGLLLTAAVCVDYGVFFLENTGRDTLRTFQAISLSAVTTAVSFACLAVADNPALQALAWTVAPGVLAGLLLCPVILRDPVQPTEYPRKQE